MNLKKYIVPGWWRMWSVWASGLALLLPDLLQAVVDNLDTVFLAAPVFDDASKAQLRIFLVVIIPIVRIIKQKPKDAS